MEFLDNINLMLTDMMGPMGPLLAVGGLGLLLVLLAIPVMLKKEDEPFSKLKASQTVAPKRVASTSMAQTLRRSNEKTDKLDKFAQFLEPQDQEQMSAARLKMMRAGYRSKNAVRIFHAAQFVLGIGTLIVGIIYTLYINSINPVDLKGMVLSTILPGAFGYYLPQYWVQRRLQTRQQEITQGFPDALDMMLVCVEAGQSLDQSIVRVSKEIRQGYPALAEEFEIVAQEVKAGKERVNVMRDMSERVGLPDVSSFVTTMIQSATFGTSIAEALRVYSAEMRDKRVMRAEEKANTLPTKLTLGTMLFTVPPLLVILIGPSLFGIAKAFGG
jgi:tight adherence protein C